MAQLSPFFYIILFDLNAHKYFVVEQQNWIELPVDTQFYVGRDLMKAKLVEMARGMMNTGNWDLLPEFKRKFDMSYGEDMMRRIGSTPSYSQILSKYKQDRDLTRHAGYGGFKIIQNTVEIEGQEVDLEDATFENNLDDLNENNLDEENLDDLNNSIELQEVVSTFDLDLSEDLPTVTNAANVLVEVPTEVVATNINIDLILKMMKRITLAVWLRLLHP